jgi:hypothetical protein
MLWPFCPRPEFTEALSWYTNTLQTYSAEQRIRLSDAPRQSFGYSHTLTHRQYERAQLLMQNGGAASWDLPVWAERQRVSVSAGASSIAVDTTASDYRAGGKAVLWASDESYELVTIATVSAASLTLSGVTGSAYTNALICPVRTAYCLGGLDAERRPGTIVEAQTEWSVYDAIDLSDAALYGSYRSHPLVTDCPRLGSGSVGESVIAPTMVVDSGLGVPRISAARSRVDRVIGMGWMPQTLAQLWALRTWMHSVYGMQKGFWLPTYTRGITLASAIAPSDTTLTIRAIGLNGVAETGDLMIQTLAGVKHCFRYTSVAAAGANEVLTLSATAGVTLAREAVDLICPLRFVRLAQDRVEFAHRHLGANRQITTVQVRAEEVPIP